MAEQQPLPWRWVTMSDADDWELRDDAGTPLLSATNSGTLSAPFPYVRTVTERAGAMEALLRKHQWAAVTPDGSRPCCPECRNPLVYLKSFAECHAEGCAIGSLLAELDAAKAGALSAADAKLAADIRSRVQVRHDDDTLRTAYLTDENRPFSETDRGDDQVPRLIEVVVARAMAARKSRE